MKEDKDLHKIYSLKTQTPRRSRKEMYETSGKALVLVEPTKDTEGVFYNYGALLARLIDTWNVRHQRQQEIELPENSAIRRANVHPTSTSTAIINALGASPTAGDPTIKITSGSYSEQISALRSYPEDPSASVAAHIRVHMLTEEEGFFLTQVLFADMNVNRTRMYPNDTNTLMEIGAVLYKGKFKEREGINQFTAEQYKSKYIEFYTTGMIQ